MATVSAFGCASNLDYYIEIVEENDEEEEECEISNAKDFFQDLDNSVEHFILDCLQLDSNRGRDPRACHSFYQLINEHFKSALARGFLKKEDDVASLWKKYDDWAACAVKEHLHGNGEGVRKFSSVAPVIPASAQEQHKHYKDNIKISIREVFQKSKNGQNQYNLADLNTRLEFFNSTSTYETDIMDHYWHRLLYSKIDQLILYLSLCKSQQHESSAGKFSSLSSLSLPQTTPITVEIAPSNVEKSTKTTEQSMETLRSKLQAFEKATRDPELNSIVYQYKKKFASTEWRQKLREEKPDIYVRLLEKERKVCEMRKANYSPEQSRNHVLKTKIRSMRKKLRDKLKKDGLSAEEIEKIVAENEQCFLKLNGTNR